MLTYLGEIKLVAFSLGKRIDGFHSLSLLVESKVSLSSCYVLVQCFVAVHTTFFCIPCSSTRGNIKSSEMVCKSTYMYDRVNKYAAKDFTDH